ncbi:MAG TPA: acyl-CoA dehydrogenase family protein [Acidimicrobiia bacterium]|nr:acyl-CoA dehydrogenase family protein [Acidimicrobiia bacterium]
MTHDVLNQAPPLEDYDLLAGDPLLEEATAREGGAWGIEEIGRWGRTISTSDVYRLADEANRNQPVLRTHDRFGFRSDTVEFHPAWHRLMELSVGDGLHSLPFEKPPGEGARVVRDAKFMLMAQIEQGHGCPISMTTSVLPALRVDSDLHDRWRDRILTRTYDQTFGPVESKSGVLLGMGMTEKQGGSDVRANTTTARPGGDGMYLLTGHKWFTSAPMCDAFLVLAQAPDGLTCFLIPRFLPDGSRNDLRLVRLKDKLGNRSNASSEMEFENAAGWRVGEEGRGVQTIIEMVNHTRLDCVVGSLGIMRQAVSQAAWHAAHRSAFGARLIDKPLMTNVIADLELEVEAATLMMVRLSGAFDRAAADPDEEAFRRIATPVAKYWVTKRCTPVVREALECLGGNGYVEESVLPRLFRESPVNAIWEGSGNVIALDVARAIARNPESFERFVEELDKEAVPHLIEDIRGTVASRLGDESIARRLTESLALAWAASAMRAHTPDEVADTYLASRIHGRHGTELGTLDAEMTLRSIADRALPVR